MEYKRLSRCGIDGCKQTKFYLEAGQWFCKIGHLREGEIDAAADDEGFGPTGRKAARASTETKRVVKVLRGRKGFELYIQCYQIILQKQVWWLIHEQGYPEELEVVVRDLWAMRLHVLSERLSYAGRSQSTAPSQSSQRSRAKSMTTDGETDHDGNSSQNSYLYTSGSDSASTTHSRRRRRKAASFVPKASDRPKLIESIGLCYLGLILIRCAVSLGDIHRWVDSQGLIYIRAIKECPEAMKEKLSGEYWTALDPPSRLRKGRLYKTVQDMVVELQEKFGLSFPPINREVLLLRYINELGLPLEIYTAVRRLSSHLFMNLSWSTLIKTKRSAYWPEARLMSLVIIATKLCYGLDGIKRISHGKFEPPTTYVDWDDWERFLRAGNDDRAGTLGESQVHSDGSRSLEVDIKEVDVFGMDGEEMDRYMDWYEKTWCGVDDAEATRLSKGILNLFPTSKSLDAPAQGSSGSTEVTETPIEPPSKPSLAERLEELNSKTKYCNPIDPEPTSLSEEGEIKRPGDKYLWYSLNEEMPNQLKILIQAGADLLAIERDDLIKVIRSIETGLREEAIMERRRKTRERNIAGNVNTSGVEGHESYENDGGGGTDEDYMN
ncbi:hypothetical protein EDC01DRAFT_309706 [Geopyxis carbonaria]|nr:hypothetical protein EDC01DRAFT_309706 [Geopyxis carbonaria]